jgi:hypothetical protein
MNPVTAAGNRVGNEMIGTKSPMAYLMAVWRHFCRNTGLQECGQYGQMQ